MYEKSSVNLPDSKMRFISFMDKVLIPQRSDLIVLLPSHLSLLPHIDLYS